MIDHRPFSMLLRRSHALIRLGLPTSAMAASVFAAVVSVVLSGCANGPTPAPTAAEAEPAAAVKAAAPSPSAPTIERFTIASDALGVDKEIVALLPPGYSASQNQKRYPVLYMLHGLGGWQEAWLRLDIAKAATEVGLGAIIILPDGDDGFYVNWESAVDYDKCLAGKRPFGIELSMKTYCVRKPRYADYLTGDLISAIDSRYRTIATRDGRAIGGLSMGGYGALLSAFRRPDLFSMVASHAGIASLRYAGPDPFVAGGAVQFEDPSVVTSSANFGPHFQRIYGDQIANWKSRDPVEHALSLTDGQLAIYIDCGTDDGFRLHNGAAHLSEVLNKRGVRHQLHLIEGGKHDAAFWRDRIDDSLRFFAAGLAPAQ